jgi:Family of unknown function (DUF5762)
MSDPFWSDSPEILLKQTRLAEFYITKSMTKIEKLNAIVRFFIYTCIVSVLYTNNPKYLLLILFALVLTYFIHVNSTENFDSSKLNFDCNDPITNGTLKAINGETEDEKLTPVKPTINNPFMNPSIFDDITKWKPTDYSDNTEQSNEVKKDIYNKFSYNLYKDVSDVFDTNNDLRTYYTVPNNVTNYDKFLNFIYKDFNHGAKQSTYNGFKNNYKNLKSQRQIT